MKILVHDYAGHPFQVHLSRALAEQGSEVIHAYASGLQTPRGELARKVGDAPTLRLVPVEMDAGYVRNKYSFFRRRRMERAYGRRVAELIMREKPGAVLSANTPTETQERIFRAARAAGAAFYPWVQDFYSLAVDKLVRKKLPVVGAMVGAWYRWLERRQFAGSERIVAITEDFAPILRGEFGIDPTKIVTIPNWAPLESLPVEPKRNAWSQAHGLADRFVYLYTGTLGLKHNPALLLELARRHRQDDQIRVVVISEGIGADWLRQQAALDPLPHLIQMDYQPFGAMPQVLAAGDVLIGVLEEDAGVFSVPSKILSYLCAARPILLAAPAVNLSTRIVARQRAGFTVPPDDSAAFLLAAEQLRAQPGLAGVMGRRGRDYAEKNFRMENIVSRFAAVLGVQSADGAKTPAASECLAGIASPTTR